MTIPSQIQADTREAKSSADMGKAMGVAMSKVDGRADGKRVSAAVHSRLGA